MPTLLALIFIFILSACSQTNTLGGFPTTTPPQLVQACLKENPQLSASQCDLAACLTDPIILLGMMDLLKETTAVLKDLGIPYWLDSGTLLGAMRFHGPLPWDDDDDIAVLTSDFEPKFQQVQRGLLERGFGMAPVYGSLSASFKLYPNFWHVHYTKERYIASLLRFDPTMSINDAEFRWLMYQDWLVPELDIFLMAPQSNGNYTVRPKAFQQQAGAGFAPSLIFPLQDWSVVNDTYQVPAQPVPYSMVWYHTPNIQTDYVIATYHSNKCNSSIRFRDIRQYPEVQDYFMQYLNFVFGDFKLP